MSKKIVLTANLAVELKTIIAMTSIYCRDHHKEGFEDCKTCEEFIDHAEKKLDRCVYGDNKPACKKCPIHCYKPEKREQAKLIMRYAGPKMILTHPILAIKHIIKAKKKFPKTIPTEISNYHKRKHLK